MASGKSTICKGIMGDVPFAEGTISARPSCFEQVSFCDQVPFLTDASVRANVVRPSQGFNGPRYESVQHATLLDVDIRQLPHKDETRVGNNGMNLSGQRQRVALARALYLNADLYILDDALSGLDTRTADEIVRRLFGAHGVLRTKTVVWCTHSTKFLRLAQQVIVLGQDGKVQSCASIELGEENVPGVEEKNDGLSPCISSVAQLAGEPEAERGGDRRLLRSQHDRQVYVRYIKALSPELILSVLVTGTLFGFVYNFGTVWVGFWTKNSFNRPTKEIRGFYLGLLGLFQVLGLVALAGFVGSTQMRMPRQAGSQLHMRALKSLFDLPLIYFSSVGAGTTTNLFSQDMSMLDNQLIFAISNTLLSGVTAIGQLAVVAATTPYIAIGYPLIFGVLCILQKYYLKTSRQLRLLDLEARSPLYSKFQDVVRGITTIRAFQWTHEYQTVFNRLLNQSLQPDYLLDLAQQWLNLILDLIVGLIAIAVTCFATQVVTAAHAALIGASLVSLLTLSELASATVRSWVQLETSIGAVKRLQDFDKISARDADLGNEPPDGWPRSGRIEIDGVSATYGRPVPESSQVLRGIHLVIADGEKIATVGRTGSGKSSLILLLLKLLHPTPDTADKITVDGISLQSISRQALWHRIITVPQEMMFLTRTESLRQLLDPDRRLSDDQCKTVLAEVGLHGMLEGLGDLSSPVPQDALSHGQKQLLSLAVAVARKLCKDRADVSRHAKTEKRSIGGILLLDEVTAHVDPETDDKIQDVIFRVFSDYTVVNVTHRLESLTRYEMVYSMSEGRIQRVNDLGDLHP